MNVLMFTNTYLPHVGGVARSVDSLSHGLKSLGHNVMIVAPTYEGAETDEDGVLRIPSIQHFRGSDFSVPIPLGRAISSTIQAFAPDLVHSHHPFFLGDTALRVAAKNSVPIIFTNHTRYDHYVHYVSQSEKVMRRLIQSLSTGYCNLCDAVVAPSASFEKILLDHGVTTPIHVIPTGLDLRAFFESSRTLGRSRLEVPQRAPVVGHVGRLGEEKNLAFLADALVRFLKRNPSAYAIVAGDGPEKAKIKERVSEAGVEDRFRLVGVLAESKLADFYASMDIFAFASKSETQGLVLAEAMAAGCAVVALDAPGVREAVTDEGNGLLLSEMAGPDDFADALDQFFRLDAFRQFSMRKSSRETALLYTVDRMTSDMLRLYESLTAGDPIAIRPDGSDWHRALRGLAKEGDILANMFHALGSVVLPIDAAAE